MAAQERAKQAQTKISPKDEGPVTTMSIAAEKEKMMKALNPQLVAVEELKQTTNPAVTMPPPPPFEILEQQQLQTPQPAPVQVQPPPPPPFTVVEDIFQQTPSAPPVDQVPDLLDGLMPMAPPVAPPPFESTMQQQFQETEGLLGGGGDMMEPEGFDFDVDGSHLSADDKRKMIEEQRAIMEQIQKQARENSASVAAVRADAFEQRSNIAAAAAAGRSTPPPNMTDMEDLSQFDADRRLAEQLQRQLNSGSDEPVMASVELSQFEADRIMAEELQREMNEENEQSSQRGASRAANQPGEKSWWDSISSALGVAEEEPQERSAEINVNRPPGGMTPSQRRLHHANVDGDGNDLHLEREGLLGSSSGSPSRHSAHVAERQPLFSCVVDSISSTANAVGDSITSYAQGEEDEVHGVDTTSFLAVGHVGRDNSSGGNYHAVPGSD